jgi:hypothetical protein
MRPHLRAIVISGVCCLLWVIAFYPSVQALEETGGVGMTVAQLYDANAPDHKGFSWCWMPSKTARPTSAASKPATTSTTSTAV